jgi:hypothetical protein
MNNGHVRFYLKGQFRTDCTLADGRPTTVNIFDSDENSVLRAGEMLKRTQPKPEGRHNCRSISHTPLKVLYVRNLRGIDNANVCANLASHCRIPARAFSVNFVNREKDHRVWKGRLVGGG